jgi:hypothetical protein
MEGHKMAKRKPKIVRKPVAPRSISGEQTHLLAQQNTTSQPPISLKISVAEISKSDARDD